jgi:hypothetical protein
MNQPAIAAATSGCISKILMYPADVVKMNMQISSRSTVPHIIKDVHERGGLTGFYKGLTLGCIRNIVMYGSRFAFFDALKDDIGVLQASIVSGVCQTFVTFPLEMWRTRKVLTRREYSGGDTVFYGF